MANVTSIDRGFIFTGSKDVAKDLEITDKDLLEVWGIDRVTGWTMQPLDKPVPLSLTQQYLLVHRAHIEVCENFSHFLLKWESDRSS